MMNYFFIHSQIHFPKFTWIPYSFTLKIDFYFFLLFLHQFIHSFDFLQHYFFILSFNFSFVQSWITLLFIHEFINSIFKIYTLISCSFNSFSLCSFIHLFDFVQLYLFLFCYNFSFIPSKIHWNESMKMNLSIQSSYQNKIPKKFSNDLINQWLNDCQKKKLKRRFQKILQISDQHHSLPDCFLKMTDVIITYPNILLITYASYSRICDNYDGRYN